MATVTLTETGINKLIARLENAEQLVMPELEAGMTEATTLVRDAEAEYPARGDYHMFGEDPKPFFSPKQQRYFFWALRNGLITVPYQRTGAYAEQWVQRVELDASTVRGIISNSSPIAGLLQGTDQARMFEGVWGKAATIFQEVKPQVRETLRAAARTAMQKLFLGG